MLFDKKILIGKLSRASGGASHWRAGAGYDRSRGCTSLDILRYHDH